MTIWETLGVPRDADRDTIRRAYARKLRVTNPEDDAEGFKVLRAAYDSALAHVEWVAKWGDYEDDDDDDEDEDDGDDEDDGEPSHQSPQNSDVAHEDSSVWDELNETGPRLAPQWAVPADAPPSVGEQSEFAEILAGRAADLDHLRGLMTELENGLRGPWRPTDAVLAERLAALLTAPAMGEITVRSDVEFWLADLLAATIPQSDAILQESIAAFGWGEDARGGYHHSTAQVLNRLEEWRTIAALNHYSHPHHVGWKSLTSPPSNALFWWLDSLRPRMVRGAEALLGDFGAMWPGLRFSFKPESLARWQAHFAKPRLTLGVVMQVPVLMIALLSLGYTFGQNTFSQTSWWIGAAVLACAGPVTTLYALSPMQRRWSADYDHDYWRQNGWLFAYVATGLLAMLLPGAWPTLIALPALGIVTWAYVVRQSRQTHTMPLRDSIALVLFLIYLWLASENLPRPQVFALGCWAMVFVCLNLTRRDDTRTILDPIPARHRELLIFGVVAAALALGWAITAWRKTWDPALPLYTMGLCVLTILLPTSTPDPLGKPSRWLSTTLMGAVLFFSFGGSMPKKPPVSSDHMTASLPKLGTGPGHGVLDAADAGQGMIFLEIDQPAFRQIRVHNPALYKAIFDQVTSFYAKKSTREDTTKAIARLIDQAFYTALPTTTAELLVRRERIRLSILSNLQDINLAACGAEIDAPVATELITPAQRILKNANILSIVGTPPVSASEREAGRAIPPDTLRAEAARRLTITLPEFKRRVGGKAGDASTCAARIALLTTLLDDHDLNDAAATLREAYRTPLRAQ